MGRIWGFLVLPAAALLTVAGCGPGSQPQEPAASEAPRGAGKQASKLSAALQQQVAGPDRPLPYSGGAPRRADGRIEVEFHAVGTVGPAEQEALRGLGAEIVTSLATGSLVPAAGVIVAWIAPERLPQAAAADWVAAVTVPSLRSQPR